jgi:hypothetical protein
VQRVGDCCYDDGPGLEMSCVYLRRASTEIDDLKSTLKRIRITGSSKVSSDEALIMHAIRPMATGHRTCPVTIIL